MTNTDVGGKHFDSPVRRDPAPAMKSFFKIS